MEKNNPYEYFDKLLNLSAGNYYIKLDLAKSHGFSTITEYMLEAYAQWGSMHIVAKYYMKSCYHSIFRYMDKCGFERRSRGGSQSLKPNTTYVGTPCKSCGNTIRYTSYGCCIFCARKASAKYNKRIKENDSNSKEIRFRNC